MRIGELTKTQPSTAWEAYESYRRTLMDKQGQGADPSLAAGETLESADTKRVNDTQGCHSCENRTYQDGSNDPGVSFKTPTRISADQAASAVRGHEMEHVAREQGKAQRENRQVVSQSVVYHNNICGECGRTYISGGTTRTTTRSQQEAPTPKQNQPKLDTYA